MIEDLNKALELAVEAFKKEYGENAKLEDGDEYFFQFNNGMMILSAENRELKTAFNNELPIKIDHTLKIYENAE